MSITVTCTSEPSPGASAVRSMSINGAGLAVFYPGCDPGEHRDGTAATFEQARVDCEIAWRALLSTRTEADFQAWRDQRDWTERKYAMWERGEKMPTHKPNSMMRCACGEMFNSLELGDNLIHVPRTIAELDERQIRRRQPTLH